MQKEKVIIDTDPWVDDALAIMYLVKSWIEIFWITTIFWNSNIENTTKNTLKILSILWKNIPVFKWVTKPLKVKYKLAKSHWDWWFWWYNINLTKKVENKKAIEFYIDFLEKNKKVVIICLWPTTNIAKLSILRPDLIKNIWKLIILWWVIGENWNITKYAEFNVYNDPDSLKIVLSLNIKKYLIPINVCRKVYFTLEDFDKINNKNLSCNIKKITKQYIDYYTNNKEYWNFQWWVMYDLLATVFYTNPEIFSFEEKYIDVVIKGKNIWEIIEKNTENKNCNVITWVEVEKLKNLFFNSMNYE